MASGRIRDFSKPDPDRESGPRILSAVPNTQGVQISQEPQQLEVTLHEEVIEEGQDRIRNPNVDRSLEIRARSAINPKEWDKVKRGEDD